jgi:hypothetical protein
MGGGEVLKGFNLVFFYLIEECIQYTREFSYSVQVTCDLKATSYRGICSENEFFPGISSLNDGLLYSWSEFRFGIDLTLWE